MIRTYDHYHSSSRRKGRRAVVVAAIAAVVVIAGILAAVLRVDRWLFRPREARHTVAELSTLWSEGRYDEALAASEALLKRDPLNPGALAFRGFAAFQKGVGEGTVEERAPWLDEAVVSLRRARLVSSQLAPEIEYILAKASYHRGKFYYDQTISFMQSAIDRGYVRPDSYEYLGMAWSQLGDPEKGLAAFLRALEEGPSDILLLTIGQTYLQMKHTGEAVDYLLRALNKTEDKAIERQARFKLGEIYLDQGEVFKAEEQYLALVELDPRSADAHFFLGEVYVRMNDAVKARAEWRAAFGLDNQHFGARLRLFK
ncbi:MAG: tetratricopeptide repeat protein [Spirochaetes bacterium]|nr:tetratricopeptide repeat protein [Spirochaetota bacterium]